MIFGILCVVTMSLFEWHENESHWYIYYFKDIYLLLWWNQNISLTNHIIMIFLFPEEYIFINIIWKSGILFDVFK